LAGSGVFLGGATAEDDRGLAAEWDMVGLERGEDTPSREADIRGDEDMLERSESLFFCPIWEEEEEVGVTFL